jgi:hypothetical protein
VKSYLSLIQPNSLHRQQTLQFLIAW